MKIYYVYALLDPRKPGKWEYEGILFDFQPFYIGKGKGSQNDIYAIRKGIKEGIEQRGYFWKLEGIKTSPSQPA